MIRPLRRRHLGMTWALAVLAPSLFIAGLVLRAPIPTVDVLPGGSVDGSSSEFTWRGDLWTGARLRTGIARDEAGMILALEPLEEVGRPDSLLYYASEPFLEVGTELPDGVILLGPLSGSRTVLRKPVIEGEKSIGTLILYNLAEQEVIGWAPLRELAAEVGS